MEFEQSTKGGMTHFRIKMTLGEIFSTSLVFLIITAFGGAMAAFFFNIPDYRNAAYIVIFITLMVLILLYISNIRGIPKLKYDPVSREVEIGGRRHAVDPEDKIILNRDIKVQHKVTRGYKEYLSAGNDDKGNSTFYFQNGRYYRKHRARITKTWKFEYKTKDNEQIHVGHVMAESAVVFNKFAEAVAKELEIAFVDKTGEQTVEMDHQDLDQPLVERLEDTEPLNPDTVDSDSIFDVDRDGAGIRVSFVGDPLTYGDVISFLFYGLIIALGSAMIWGGYLLYTSVPQAWFTIFSFLVLAIPGISLIIFSISRINKLKWIDYIRVDSDEIEISRDHLLFDSRESIPLRELERIVLVDLKNGSYGIEFVSNEIRHSLVETYVKEDAQELIIFVKRAMANYY